MRWREARKSTNVEDRRGMRVGRPAVVGGGIGVLVLVVIALLVGEDPSRFLEQVGVGTTTDMVEEPAAPGFPQSPGKPDEASQFVAAVLGSTEDAWGRLFSATGLTYEPPTLVLFTETVQSACGFSSAASGPFYCPGDGKVYLDLSFFRELDEGFGAPGDFAQAYVIAHEVGHHVQNLLGVSEAVQRRGGGEGRNSLSVRMELQADCYAGVWGHHAGQSQGLLDPGDAEEGLRAAAAIGDDRIQRRSTGVVNPESWTHGSAEQRLQWLQRGLETGDPAACDTFQ